MTSLSPAEALLLLRPNRTAGTRTIRVTLLSLLATGVLRIEERLKRGVFRDRKVAYMHIVPEQVPASPPHVSALIGIVRAAQADGGRVRDVASRAAAEFGAGCALYNSRFIVPSLIGRGLVEERRIMFVRSLRATPAGEAERQRIEADIARARQLPGLLNSNPAEAAALALALGGTLLLVDDLRTHYGQLAAAMRARGGSADGGDGGGGATTSDGAAGFDPGCVDLGGFDAGAFDALDACAGSFDAGLGDAGFGDAGGGDSGGDSGGGTD